MKNREQAQTRKFAREIFLLGFLSGVLATSLLIYGVFIARNAADYSPAQSLRVPLQSGHTASDTSAVFDPILRP